MDTARARYSGPSRKLVVALDIGTTFSGAAYAFLDPGEIPQIRSVTKQAFPPIPDLVTRSNELRHRYLNNPNPGSAKVPSILYYDRNGNFRGVENRVDFQDSDGLLRMKWWGVVLRSPVQNADSKLGGS
jgi:molecular chaperone DnaK (HSP70)